MASKNQLELNRVRRARYKSEGLCQCGRELSDRFKTCEKCRAENRASRQRRLAANKCEGCGSEQDNPSQNCTECIYKRVAHRRLGSKEFASDIKARFLGTCALSGVSITIGDNAHLDHIKPISTHPELKSDLDNVQWVHEEVNWMKCNMTQEHFLEMCQKVVDFHL